MNRLVRSGFAAVASLSLGLIGLTAASGGSAAADRPPVQLALLDATQFITPTAMEGIFVPVSPCRIADTRVGDPIAAGQRKTFRVRGTYGFDLQGGKAGGCGIPFATAVALSITTVNSSGDGRLTAWPFGEEEPKSTVLSFWGDRKVTSTPTVKLAESGVAPHLSIKAHDATTDVVIDVLGYYAPQIRAIVTGTGGMYAKTPRVLTSSRDGEGRYTLTVDRDVTYCAPTAVVKDGGYTYASAGVTGNKVKVWTWFLLSTGERLPYDFPFYLTVQC